MRPTSPCLLLAFLVGLLACGGCLDFGKKKEEKKETAPEVPLIRPAPLARRTLNRTIEITGEVEALSRVEVTPRLGGVQVLALKADLGDTVKIGDELALLDGIDMQIERDDARVVAAECQVRTSDAALAVKELEAQLRGQRLSTEQARKAVDRAKAQAEKGAIAQEQLDSAQSKYDTEKAGEERLAVQIEKSRVAEELARKAAEKAALSLSKAERNVQWASVKAPISGIISKRPGKLGQQTVAGQPLFEIFDPTTTSVTAQITQRDLPHVRAGMRVELRTDALPNEVFDSEVTIVSPVIDPQAGTVPIRISVKDPAKLKPGLFVSGRIVVEAKPNVLVAPKKAVLYERERPYVFKLESAPGGTLRVNRVFFREGLSGRDEVEMIFGDESDGRTIVDTDRIVLVGQDRLRDGDVVQLESPSSRPSDAPQSKSSAGN